MYVFGTLRSALLLTPQKSLRRAKRHIRYRLDSAFNHGDHPSWAAEGFLS
jgi:hypothetical protein